MFKTLLILSTLLLISCSTTKTKKPKFDARLTGYDYPFEVHNYKFESQNQSLEMSYMDVRPQGKYKQTIVLLHGKNFSGFYWERIANDLVKKGYRVIIPDQIGFGKSSKPESYQFSFYQLALNTKGLLDSLNLKSYKIVGHSMGGMLATHFTYLYPTSVKKLILINPIGLEPYLKYVQYKDPQFFYKNELKKNSYKLRKYQQKNYYDGDWKDEYQKLLVPTIGQINGNEWNKVAWNNALTYGPIFAEDITRLFKDIKTKTALIIGTRDKTGPGRNWKKPGVKKTLGDYTVLGKRAHKKLRNSRLYEIRGLGHMPQYEDYETFSKVFTKAIR